MKQQNVTLFSSKVVVTEGALVVIACKYGNKQLVAEINFSVVRRDMQVIAELLALQRFMDELNVMGEARNGKNLILRVSSEKILNFMHGRTPEKHLSGYGDFLLSRFRGVRIEVDKASEIDTSNTTVETINFDGPPERTPIETPVLGEVILSKHVIERFEERGEIKAVENTLKRLKKIICKETLQRLELAKDVLERKRKKYGDVITEYWFEPNTKWKFVVICNNNQRLVTTAYF